MLAAVNAGRAPALAGGRVQVDGLGRTTNPRLYAGGDNTPGPDLVVTALAAGRRAAAAILADHPTLPGLSRVLARRRQAARPAPAPVA